jgi:glycerol-3-phosphate O-acyltransferase
MLDEISAAVLSRQDVLKYPREQVSAYLEELRTTQRHRFYRALQHPLYPILRKIERLHENLHHVSTAVRSHRIVYTSNHKSHTDYLVEPLVLDDNGIRPPLIAAGINLFGGPLGLINKHVTGAIPIRRNTKDPAYLITLKAYVAEIVKKHDIFFYPEGGRSYSGELKPAKTGLFNAVVESDCPSLVIIPVAIAYDLVLEDHILAHQRVKKRQRPFPREVAEMVRYAVGYRSRAFTTFGAPLYIGDRDFQSRSDVLELARIVRQRIGMLYKVLPTALFAAAMRPNIARRDLEARIDRLIDELAVKHANLGAHSGRQVVEEAAEPLETRGVVVAERGRFRVRERTVLRYYARTIEHLLVTPGRTH